MDHFWLFSGKTECLIPAPNKSAVCLRVTLSCSTWSPRLDRKSINGPRIRPSLLLSGGWHHYFRSTLNRKSSKPPFKFLHALLSGPVWSAGDPHKPDHLTLVHLTLRCPSIYHLLLVIKGGGGEGGGGTSTLGRSEVHSRAHTHSHTHKWRTWRKLTQIVKYVWILSQTLPVVLKRISQNVQMMCLFLCTS